MNKKLLTLAVGAALAVPMMAQADVKISGQAHVSADYVDTLTTGPNNEQAKYWNISSNVSNITVSASEDLGGGMKGIFFLQEYFRLDDNGGNSSATTKTATRMHDAPAYAGLGGGFGTVVMGNLDGPAKATGRSVDLFGNQIGDSRNAGVDNTRFQNAIAYLSPNWSGFSFVVAHATNVDNGIVTPTNTAANGLGGPNTSQLYGTAVQVKYDQGPLMVAGSYTMVDDRVSTSPTYDTTNLYNLAASFKFGGARIVGFYQGASAVGNNPNVDQDVYGLGASFTFGNETVKAQWYNLTNKPATGDVSSSVYALGYDHAFSKTFTGYAAIAVASNDLGNSIGMAAGGGHGDSPANYSGGDQNGLSLGIIYNF